MQMRVGSKATCALPRRKLDWKHIMWRKVEKKVKMLQMRIAQAVRENFLTTGLFTMGGIHLNTLDSFGSIVRDFMEQDADDSNKRAGKSRHGIKRRQICPD